MRQSHMSAVALGFAMLYGAVGTSNAAEVKVISGNGLKSVLEELAPRFEKATENKLAFTWGASSPLKVEIEKGATFDLTILTLDALDDLAKQGKVVGSTRTALANSLIGVVVRKGAPKPDISTVEAFKQALINAKSFAYVEQGASGIYLKTLLPRLGLSDALKNKTTLLPPEIPAAKAVTDGIAEISMTQISEILPYPGAELVGPLPKEIQLTTSFGAAVGAAAKEPAAASALIKFLISPEAATVIKAKGLEPAG